MPWSNIWQHFSLFLMIPKIIVYFKVSDILLMNYAYGG